MWSVCGIFIRCNATKMGTIANTMCVYVGIIISSLYNNRKLLSFRNLHIYQQHQPEHARMSISPIKVCAFLFSFKKFLSQNPSLGIEYTPLSVWTGSTNASPNDNQLVLSLFVCMCVQSGKKQYTKRDIRSSCGSLLAIVYWYSSFFGVE